MALTLTPDDSAITYCKIYPGIGIARVGNSPDEFFIGPEAPGHAPEPAGGYKDLEGRIKRQAARFRVYGFDADGKMVKEITADAAGTQLVWTVELANKKASWFQFKGVRQGLLNDQTPDPKLRRNLAEENRERLEITPGARSIGGPAQHGPKHEFGDGSFYDIPVPLGELRTDAQGRLLVLGGRGFSSKTGQGKPITQYANNNYWHDDTSDGPVTAAVRINNRDIPVAGSSWVIVAPPKFTPTFANIVTLYDVMSEAAGFEPPETFSFQEDIYPFFARMADYQWLNAMALRGHGPKKHANFRDPEIAARLADNSAAGAPFRHAILARIRNPRNRSVTEANYTFMPILSGDEGDVEVGKPDTWLYLLESQYAMLEEWARGNFTNDWDPAPPAPPVFDQIPLAEQPAALDRAALEYCVGGPFFPGIEITYIARDKAMYGEPFRFKGEGHAAGDITKRMAVPWQADFYECQTHWWPAQRPDDVLNEASFLRGMVNFSHDARDGTLAGALTDRIRWDRGLGDRLRFPETPAGERAPRPGDNDMVEQWKNLGFVVPRVTPAGEVLYVETGRSQYDGLRDRDYFYYLLNMDSYPDFLPQARALAEKFLADAETLLNSENQADLDDMYRFFEYSPEALAQRLDEIYAFYQADGEADPFADPGNIYQIREDMVERIRQFAPLNQMDGAWLRNIAHAGPIDPINAFLFSIWMDEVGDGIPDQNHANVYTDLMGVVGIRMAPVNSRAYADNADLLDSAFTVPMYELAISQFTQTYFPEILGMTMQLEWEVLALKPTIKLFRGFNLDPHFYELHVGIDNAADGHGAKAREAVEEYLDQARARGGDAEVARLWQRIWTGYTAFATTGTLAQDLREMLQARRDHPPTPADKVAALIEHKKQYGSLNHGDKQIGRNHINDLFEDTTAFMDSLIAGGYIVPGSLTDSSFFRLTSFNGPMYKVFNEEEIKVWENWVVWLGQKAAPGPVQTDPAKLMAACIDTLRARQQGTLEHGQRTLSGPNPANPQETISQPVSAWFDAPTRTFMAVLSDPANGWIVKGEAANSRFVTQLIGTVNAMSQAFDDIVSNSGGKTGKQIAIEWINKGCPLPAADRTRAFSVVQTGRLGLEMKNRLTLTSSRFEVESHPRQRVLGMGCVH